MRRRHVLTSAGREVGSRGNRPRELHVGGVTASAAHGDLVLPGCARRHEFVRALAAHHPRVRLDDVEAQPAALEDSPIGALVSPVGRLERRVVGIERVRILHHELARAQHTGAGPGLVAFLRLDLIPDLGQVPVRADLARGQPRHHLLVSHAETQLTPVAVLELEHLGDPVPPARLLPDLGRMDHRHRDLLAPDRVHLVTDDRVDLVEDAVTEGEPDEHAGSELAYEARAQHERVTQCLGLRRLLTERRNE
jgi:hypothetical protein